MQGMKSAMSDTPSNYKESVNYYKTQLGYKLQDVVNFASDIYEVEEEVKRGTMEFAPLVCRITNAISPKTGHNQGKLFAVYYSNIVYYNTSNCWNPLKLIIPQRNHEI